MNGAATPDGSFGFGTAGAYLAADPGNREAENREGKCHVEVNASRSPHRPAPPGTSSSTTPATKRWTSSTPRGEYLDQTKNAAFADAEPTAVAIDRSGTANDGTLYVTAGAGAGAKALAFGPLTAPSRAVLPRTRSPTCCQTPRRWPPTPTATSTRWRAASSTSTNPTAPRS